jgi:hypothetical protein
MSLINWLKTPGFPPLCGCGVRATVRENGFELQRSCPKCGEGETLTLGSLQAAASRSALVEQMNTRHAR